MIHMFLFLIFETNCPLMALIIPFIISIYQFVAKIIVKKQWLYRRYAAKEYQLKIGDGAEGSNILISGVVGHLTS